MNSILLTILLTTATTPFEAQTLDGRTLTGSLAELTADRITLDTSEGHVPIETKNLLTISRKGKVRRAAAVVVELADGSVVQGRQYTAHGDQSRIVLAHGEIVACPANLVQTVRLQQTSGVPAAEWSRLVDRKAEADLLVTFVGGVLDYHKGVIHDVTEDVVYFGLDGEVLPVKRSKIYGLAYRHHVDTELPPAACQITDSSGSRWSAQSLALAGDLQWTTPTGLVVSRPPAKIVRIDFSSGKLVYLSDLQPESTVSSPYFGMQKPPRVIKQFHAPRFDRGFESAALQLNGVRYFKGMAMRSRTELVYRLSKQFSRFLAIAGIDDAVRPGGRVRLVIRGDDNVLLNTVIAGTDPPRPIDLDLTNVQRLTIVVDFGDGLVAGDQLLLCNARVLK